MIPRSLGLFVAEVELEVNASGEANEYIVFDDRDGFMSNVEALKRLKGKLKELRDRYDRHGRNLPTTLNVNLFRASLPVDGEFSLVLRAISDSTID